MVNENALKEESLRKRKRFLLAVIINASILVLYFVIWMFFDYLWVKARVSNPEYFYLTLPVVLFLIDLRFVEDPIPIKRYSKIAMSVFVSCAIWVWLIFFLGVAFHWHIGGKY